MYKRILAILLCLGLVFTGIAVAQPEETVDEAVVEDNAVSITDVLQNIPNVKQGVVYSIEDQTVKYVSTLELANWKGLSLEGGFIPVDKEIVGVVSYSLVKLKDLGVTLPILDLLECNLGYYAGASRIDSSVKFDHGVSVTLINVKF